MRLPGMLPDTMTAIAITAAGGPEVLVPETRPVPVPGHGQILIRVAYAGVNRPDVLQRMGAYAPPPGASELLGLECAGTVAEVGAGVTRWRVGDRVCALLPGGGYAEYALTPAAHALPVPEGMTLAEGGGLPETAFTVWSTVIQRGRLQAGERFLVHGGASGIGTMAIQVARQAGARVFATASAGKLDAVAGLGATAIDYGAEDFAGVLKEAGGADLILDMVGGDYLPRNVDALADDGRLVMIAFLKGARGTLNFAEIMRRRLTITGATLRPQSDAAKAGIAAALEAGLWPDLASGAVRVLVDRVLPLREAAEAHRVMEAGGHVGKIVLEVAGG